MTSYLQNDNKFEIFKNNISDSDLKLKMYDLFSLSEIFISLEDNLHLKTHKKTLPI